MIYFQDDEKAPRDNVQAVMVPDVTANMAYANIPGKQFYLVGIL